MISLVTWPIGALDDDVRRAGDIAFAPLHPYRRKALLQPGPHQERPTIVQWQRLPKRAHA